jgi:D-alanyl-D-alanine carboxypeptidase
MSSAFRKVAIAVACAILLVTTFGAAPAVAAPDTARVQAAMDAAIAAGVPGMVAATRGPDGTWRGTAGVGELGTGRTPEASGRFRVASVSKTFTATLVLQLASEGRLGLDDPVSRYLPGLLPYPEPITIRQLLQHTSGVPRDIPPELGWASLPELDTERFVHFSPEDAIKASTTQPLLFAPGAGWSYSNTGYIVLALLVEKVTGQRIERALAQRITGPLGLHDTYLVRDFPLLPRAASRGYEQLYPAPHGLTDVTEYNYSRYVGAGSMISSAGDVNRFYRALLGGRLLRPDLLAQMKHTVPATDPTGGYAGYDYGLGLMHLRLDQLCGAASGVWGHQGSLPGFGTWSMHEEQADRQITSVGNQNLTGTADSFGRQLRVMLSEFCPVLPSTAALEAAPLIRSMALTLG